MALMFEQFEFLAEQNPAQYMELMNALQQTYTKLEMEAAFAENMAKYAEYEVIPNAAGHTFINTGTRIAGEYLGPVSSSTETALELATEAYDYEVLGADGQILYRANMGAMKDAAATKPYQSASLLSLDVGVVGAAIAPILGVAIGAGLYENNPMFWTTLSQKLLPFCYPGTTEIPGWLDVVESVIEPGTFSTKVVVDKRVVDAVKEYLDEFREKILPGYKTTGVYTFNVNLSLDDVLSIAFSMCPDGVAVDDSVITAFRNLLANYPNSPFTISMWTGTESYEGWSPLTLRVFKSIAIGDSVNLDSLYEEDYIETYGRKNPGGILTIDNPQIITSVNGYLFIGENNDIENHRFSISSFNGYEVMHYPEGTEEWQGDSGSITPYGKKIIYMQEDPENPGSFIVAEEDGIEIALPEKSTWPKSEIQSTKPENWPEDEPWPMEIEFPWERPGGYEGDWPVTTTWPLPADKPDYWPDVIPYPRSFSYPAPSINPEDNPNPNENADPILSGSYIESSQPGTKLDPSDEPEPQPQPDPSIPNPTITAVIPADPPGPPGVTDPPPDEGETPLPVTPIIDLPFTSANDGLITVYHPTDAQLKAFASWLWVTYADPSIEKLWNNPFDGVIGLMELYCTPTDVGMKNIRSGFLDSGVSSQTISRYTEIDCGSIYVPEYYGNYLDYSPYAKAHVYLPFIGIVELNVDDVVGHGINITYKIDEYNGACIAIITCARHVEVAGDDVDYSAITYQFSGNCAVELPLAGGTQSAIRAGLIQAAAYGLSSVVGGIVSGVAGNIGGAVSQIGYGAANAIGSVVSAKSSVQHSGSFGSSYGALGLKVPFIIVSRPKQLQVLNYQKIYGFPAHAGVTIGSCRGYLRVREVHVLSSTATDEEKKRIEELLKEGVYVTE